MNKDLQVLADKLDALSVKLDGIATGIEEIKTRPDASSQIADLMAAVLNIQSALESNA